MASLKPLVTVEIVAVGSELLTPYRRDTNSLTLTGMLNEAGLSVRAKHIVGDRGDALRSVLRAALAQSDVVITTGGLGPTDDDLTREAVAGVLGRPLVEVGEIAAGIAARFERRGMVMPAINRRQAQVIEGARWLANAHGTAPGQLLDVDGRVIVLLPGPPREMHPMFTTDVLPWLAARAAGRRIRQRVIRTTGRSESQVEELAQPIYSRLVDLVPSIETTILASPGLVELHLTCSGSGDPSELDAALDRAVARLASALGDIVFSVDGRSLEEVVGELLSTRGWRIAIAESCTGGLLAGRLTDVAGSSAWVRGGVVAYDNAVKTDVLGVDPRELASHGAVSAEVARAMAEGVRARLGTEVGVAITGIAGPAGGSADKPVGTVFISVAATASEVRRYQFPGDRAMVRSLSIGAALDLVRRHATG